MLCPRCYREYDASDEHCQYDGERLNGGPKIDLIPSAKSQQTGAIVGGRYQIRGFLGKGAMARVYVAEDLQTKEPVALKILHGAVAHREPEVRARFLREATAADRIGHPNIMKIFASGERADGVPYLVLEFLFGESLGQLLRREPMPDEDIALPILAQIASGLAAAHEAGIVHRDVKPDNVFLVGQPGEPYGVKVVDFGFAKLAEAGFTVVGTAIGTPEYMAPEQVLTDPSDGRTDVYALGVVMYRMFTGRLPFAQQSDLELLGNQLLVPPARPSLGRPDLDPRIEAVILKALRKRPDNRYPSMQAFLEDLERLLGEREGDVTTGELSREPDAFEPRGPLGQAALPVFRKAVAAAG